MTLIHEYSSPKLYDCEYGRFTDDFDIFCTTVTKGTALDIACGTGRITIQLAKMGLHCTGIDESQSMLFEAHQKSKNLGLEIIYLMKDMRNFNLNQQFDLIKIGGNSFQALLTEKDQKDFIACVSHHLKRQGLFIMNMRNTIKEEMQTTDHFEHWHDFIDDKGETVKVYGVQTFNSLNNIVKYKTKRIWQDHETLSEIKLKFTDINSLTNLLRQNGLKILKLYGNFSKEEFDPVSSKDVIIICGRELAIC